MNISDLQAPKQANPRRVGRGISAGGGKTAGRGTKGQNSRSGGQRNPGFEGGQSSLLQRLPKQSGFKSLRSKLVNIHTSQLENLAEKVIDQEVLVKHGLIGAKDFQVKLLFDAPVKKAYTVKLTGASTAARESLVAAGGSFEAVEVLRRPARTKSETPKTAAKSA